MGKKQAMKQFEDLTSTLIFILLERISKINGKTIEEEKERRMRRLMKYS